ncbi:MAG: LEA type 2 family protein [Gemmatimonadetes bacterium]|nr:LEA type 2 family protein [Gemmatimonadota bacterium]
MTSLVSRRGRVGLRWAVASVMLVWLASACALAYQPPSVQIAAIRVTELGLTGGVCSVRLDVMNPNRFGVDVRSLDYRLEVESGTSAGAWRELASDASDRELHIAPRSTTSVELEVPFRYEGLGEALRAFLERGSVRYRARGSARVAGPFGQRTVPFQSAGEFGRGS